MREKEMRVPDDSVGDRILNLLAPYSVCSSYPGRISATDANEVMNDTHLPI